MGRLKVTLLKEVDRDLPLGTSTLLGRGAQCTWTLDEPSLPLYWVEIRWTGADWKFRLLARAEFTSPRFEGWRPLEGETVVYGTDVQVELSLEDPSPPEAFAIDLSSGEPCRLEQLATPLGAGCARLADDEMVSDGDVEVVGGRPYRFFIPDDDVATRVQLDLRHTRLELWYRRGGPFYARLSEGVDATFPLTGSAAMILTALALYRQHCEERFETAQHLTNEELHPWVVESCGVPRARPSGLNLDWLRLRKALKASAFSNHDALVSGINELGGRPEPGETALRRLAVAGDRLVVHPPGTPFPTPER